jgi:uncharacterized protein with ATP-grasp and redox domains
MSLKPLINIPPRIYGFEPDSWANFTVVERFPRIIESTLRENDFSYGIVSNLENLANEIVHGQISYIHDPGVPDLESWNNYVETYFGQGWTQPPWFFTEHYYYRRIIQSTQYFQYNMDPAYDPFKYQKRMGLSTSIERIREVVNRINPIPSNSHNLGEIIDEILTLDLWGNQADLSLWPVDDENKPDHPDTKKAKQFILVNDACRVVEFILDNCPLIRVDILIDNAGFEVVCDLLMADLLLQTGLSSRIKFHLKKHPTFVSDATKADILETVETLIQDKDQDTKDFGKRLNRYIDQEQLVLDSNWFWTSPLDGWDMPTFLREELSRSSMVISKGDAHYRRLLGDRHWPVTTSFKDILAYYPVPLLALRTLKSELAVGLTSEIVKELPLKDPKWLTNGNWGVIQFNFG